jgi:hypothetical protein
MDAFDFKVELAQAKRVARRSYTDLIWNILTVILLIMTVCVALAFISIMIDPYTVFNPFKPPTLPALASSATVTPTSRNELPSTWTPEPTEEPTATSTPRPSATPLPTDTPIPVLPSETPTAGPTPVFSFALQQGSPQTIPNIYHPDLGCNWMGVAGQATALNGGPATGLIVQVGGSLPGQLFESRISLTGAVTQYGQAGYEIPLADKAIDSKGTLWIQLLDNANLPFSDKIYFDTFADCQKNLIVINFQQVK